MTATPYKNKNSNTFKFKSFADRIAEIDIRRLALYHIGHENEELIEDNETYFHQTLKKWTVLNLSDEFVSFSRKCSKIITLPQVIHRKDFLIDILLEHLATATTLSLQPLLELTYVLARDLREEYYAYFQRILDRLICLLNTQDADQLEWTLVCLAHLFKTLKPHMKRNIGVVFNSILPLLDEQCYEEHVTNFAVECFSYIARDIRDFEKFLNFIMDTVSREQVEGVKGCGRLFFEIVRGTQGRFHSVAGEFLRFLFQALTNERNMADERMELLSSIVSEAIQNILEFVTRENIGLFWTILCDVTKAAQIKDPSTLTNLLPVFIQAVQYRKGKSIAELDTVMTTVLEMVKLSDENCNETALEMLGTLISKLMLSEISAIKSKPLISSRLAQTMLSINNRDQIERFILLTMEHTEFEVLILPSAMRIFDNNFDLQSFKLLARIVLEKQPLAFNAINLIQWKQYPLTRRNETTVNKLTDKLKQFKLNNPDCIEENLLLLLLIPHFTYLNKATLQHTLNKATCEVLTSLEEHANSNSKEFTLPQLITILAVLIETQIHLSFKLPPTLQLKVIQAISSFISHNMYSLGCLDQVLSTGNDLKELEGTKIADSLAPLLSSHHHEIRLTAAHALSSLHSITSKAKMNPYKILYEAESIVPNIHNYREQLLHLQKLDPTSEFFKIIEDDHVVQKNILRFLLGTLYNNFKYIWEPVLKLIESYSKVMPINDFWDIYKEKMLEINSNIEKAMSDDLNCSQVNDNELCPNNKLSDLLENFQIPALNQKELFNYRNLLWLRLPQYGQLSEIKNRDLIGIFLTFVHEEYRKKIEKREFTWNLKEFNEQLPEPEADENEDENLLEKTEVPAPSNSERVMSDQQHKRSKRIIRSQITSVSKTTLQTLETMIGMFVHQVNPKALYREQELHSLWLDLLAGPNAQLQKLALDCLLSYKNKAHTPYKEHLYALIDEKKFKDELINFKLETITSEHRTDFMPLLLRILYGKMITHGSQRTPGTQVRKGLVLRFLGQCNVEEIIWFLHMAFGRYEQYIEEKIALKDIPRLVHEHFDLSTVWSPKKLQSIVNLLELIRKEFGGLMDMRFHLYMLKLLTFVGSVCNEVEMHAEIEPGQMHPKIPVVFKNVKNSASQSLVNFFAHIDDFPWEDEDINCLSLVFIWPSIERLPQEGIHSPTVLLKLLLLWGEKPQHFHYLNQQHPKTKHVIFHYIIALLLNEKAKPTVQNTILGLIERLLTVAASSETSDSLLLIKPFISEILKRLKMNFIKRSQKSPLDKRSLNILSLLTSYVEDSVMCDNLLQLLLPVFLNKIQSTVSEDVVCQLITTLANLINNLETPQIYIPKIAPLFERVQEVQARKLLVQLISGIAKKQLKRKSLPPEECIYLKNTARLMFMLNAWDKRWVEQPDYNKRLDALKEVAQMLTEQNVDLQLGVLVIYNCFYFIRCDKDLGMRDNASEHLKLLVPQLIQKYADDKEKLNFLIGDVLLNLLQRLIRDNNDNVRQEGVRLLGVMARECPQAHEILLDLSPLTDRQDDEVDFFENIVHLQSHRHGRALLRFCNIANTLTKTPNARTITQFILPLASRYLLNEKYAGKHTVIDAAIETVGVSCQVLPWPQYHAVLRYYLMKMRTMNDYQKQCVRIVVRILDSFHFDLSKAQTDEESLQKLKSVLKEESICEVGEVRKEKEEKEDLTNPKKTEDATDDAVNKTTTNEDEDGLGSALDTTSELSDSEMETSTNKSERILEKPLVLTPNASKRVMATIASVLIPTLNRSITEKSSYDAKHKLNRKRFSAEREEEEILRVPIALALVKLMQKLPKDVLETSLPGVFMKVCTFLRSPLKSVRMLTRDILKKIMLNLGASYLPLIVDHLQSLLTRGFQVHVLAVTVHGILDALRDQLQPKYLESCLSNLLEVALNDIFGEITAEKEVQKITSHTPEAKPSAKSYLVLHIIARNICEHSFLDLLMPFKEHLMRGHSRKLILKIQDCFAKIVAGLVENVHISRESLLILIYGTISESIVDLLPGTQKRELSDQEKERMRRARSDCYIIPPAPQRCRPGVASSKTVRTNTQANAHVLIEFGLEMLHIVLKRKKLLEITYQPFLNPLVPLLKNALQSTHCRVTTFALKCLTAIWNDEYELLALQEELPAIVRRLFEILNNFSTFGASRQEDNQQLIKSAYKTIVALLRKCTDYTLSAEQLDQLVLTIEQDLFEGENQAMSFSLLKALLTRKVDTPAIHDIMKKLSDLSIVSPSDFIRDEARAMICTYVMEYTLKRRIDQILKYFSVQLCYTLPTGRQSAIKFLSWVVKKFPHGILAKRAEFLYLSLGTRLVNDEDPECRRAIAECIEQLIARLNSQDRKRLFDMTLLFFSDAANKASVREMAAALCSRFLNVERANFGSRLKLILPTLVTRLTFSNPSTPGRFVRVINNIEVTEDDKVSTQKRKKRNEHDLFTTEVAEFSPEEMALKQRAIDHEIIQIQYCLLKILEHCSADLFSCEDFVSSLDELAYESQRLLAHEHAWVRCNAAKTIALILSNYDFEEVSKRLKKVEEEEEKGGKVKLEFIYTNPEYDIKSLVLDLCAQMIPGITSQPIIDEAVKIFLYIANILRDVPFKIKQESKSEQLETLENEITKINLNWLLRNIRFLINKEVVKAPHCTSIRGALFNLLEGLIMLLNVETVERLAPTILSALVREMSDDDQNIQPELKQQALRVGSKLRKRIGSDNYDKLRSEIQAKLMTRRAERRKLIAQEKVHDPLRAAKRKIGVQKRKKLSKKLKTEIIRGKIEDTKQKLKKRKRKAAEENLF